MTRAISISACLFVACAAPPIDQDADPQWMPHALDAAEHADTRNETRRPPPYVPLRAPGDAPDVTVYGYWPYWGDPIDTMPWDQLTHLAIFDVGLESDGSLSSTYRWTDNAAEAMALAAPYGVSVHLCVTSFSDTVMNTVLPSPGLRTDAIDALVDLVDLYGAHGVNVDFEGLDYAMKADFVAFVQELSDRVDEVYVAMPAVDWLGAYDFDELAFASDGLFIMGYGYHWSGGNPGPISPLYGSGMWGSYALDWTLDDYRTWGAPDASIVMGLPLYGRHWETTDNSVPGVSTGTSWAEVFTSAVSIGATHGRSWDADSDTAYTFPDGASQLWYDDTEALTTKVAWAIDEGVQGVGFWAMTYEDADPGLWAAIDALTHGESLRLEAPSPGVAGVDNTLVVTGAEPGEQVLFAFGTALGSAPVAGCAETLDLHAPRLLGLAVADASGEASLVQHIPARAAGKTAYFQAVQRSSCTVSAPVEVTFP